MGTAELCFILWGMSPVPPSQQAKKPSTTALLGSQLSASSCETNPWCSREAASSIFEKCPHPTLSSTDINTCHSFLVGTLSQSPRFQILGCFGLEACSFPVCLPSEHPEIACVWKAGRSKRINVIQKKTTVSTAGGFLSLLEEPAIGSLEIKPAQSFRMSLLCPRSYSQGSAFPSQHLNSLRLWFVQLTALGLAFVGASP